jgi:predicted porin
MQKKIIALAVAGLVSGAAFAQSNVTIYGVADATFDNVKATGSAAAATDYDSRNRITSNSSFIGFKGTEDLGGGLKAMWQFENGLNTENGAAGAWNNRDSYVGLSGGFGTVVMGNITGPTRALGAKMDVNAGSTGIGANSAMIGKLGGGSGASAFDQRISNAIAYISPNFSGFNGVIGYMANENKSLNTDPLTANTKAWTLGLNYESGPIYVGYAYTKIDPVNTTNDTKSNRLGFKYSTAGWTAGLLWDKVQQDVTAGEQRRTAWYIPVTFNVTGNGKLIAQYGRAGNVSNTAADESAKHFVVGYEHSLSKRTVLKALWSQIKNDGGTYNYLYGVGADNSTATAASGAGAGADPKGFSVGIRHSF